MSPRIVQATPCGGLRLHLRFDDGAEGVVDLSHLKGRGVFSRWDLPGEFEKVVVDPEWRTVRWLPGPGPDQPELDLCPDVLYHEVTGKPLPGARARRRERERRQGRAGRAGGEKALDGELEKKLEAGIKAFKGGFAAKK